VTVCRRGSRQNGAVAGACSREKVSLVRLADDGPLNPGDKGVVVTIEIPDDEACDFPGPGQPITLWHGSDVGHGVISRRVFFTSMP
jgi:hypothetical protein